MGVYSAILEAVRAAILGSSSLPKSVFVRKRIYRDKDLDGTLPAVYIAPTVERKEGLHFSNSALIDYPVLVAVISQSAHVLINPFEMLDMRDVIRSLLWRTSLSGAPTVFDCDYNPSPAYDLSGLDATYDVSIQQFVFRSQEDRV